MAKTINPNPYGPQVAARKAFKTARKQSNLGYFAQRKNIIATTKAQGGAAGAEARRTQLRGLWANQRSALKAGGQGFRATTRANWVAAGKPGQGAPAPGSFTDLRKNNPVVKPPSAAKVSNTKQLLKRANGTGRNAAKRQ